MNSTIHVGMNKSSLDNNSFAWQYTSLMIIILAFVIGAFNRDSLAIKSNKSEAVDVNNANHAESKINLVKGGFLTNDLFHRETNEVNYGKYEALLSVLMNHDISLQIELFGEGCNPEASEDCRSLLFQRAESIHEKFYNNTIPTGSVKIYVVNKPSDAQAKVTYYEEKV